MSVRQGVVALAIVLSSAAGASGQQAPAPHAGHGSPAPAKTAPTQDPHAGHEAPRTPAPDPHAGHAMPSPQPPDPHAGHAAPPAEGNRPLPASVVPITDAMRAAAFPDVHGHGTHDSRINGFLLFDKLEWHAGNGPGSLSWSNSGWVGGDINRVWFRTEGDGGGDDGLEDAQAHVLYGRAIARWWDVVAGVRQDIRPGTQTWLAVGVQGLAPGFFEVEATAYLSDEGQTAAHAELEYDLLLTNRLVLQPTVELNVYGKPNASLGVGSGLSTVEGGFRLRYHISREIAPYVGVSWARAFGATADLARQDDAPNGAPRLVTGLRVWF